MLRSKLSVDLPSEIPAPPSTVVELVGWLLDRQRHPPPELQQILIDNLTLFEGFLRAFADAGFDDVVSVVVDGRTAYLDVDEKIGDLQIAIDKTVESGLLDDGLSILRACVSGVEDGLRVLAELRATARVPEGTDEVSIRISAREEDLDLRDEEGPREYAARLRAYIRDPDRIAHHRGVLKRRVAALCTAIPGRIPGARVTASPVTVRIVALGPRQVGRLRHLGFRTSPRRTVTSALPVHEQIGAYDDPLTRHYYTPYQELFDWIALGEVLAGHWSQPWVQVVHPSGRLLFAGDQGASQDPAALAVPRDAVRVDGQGRLVVDASIAHVEPLEIHDTGSPEGPGWAGEAWTEQDEG